MNTLFHVSITLALCSHLTNADMTHETQTIIDFSKKMNTLSVGVTNDGVMGGLSQGKIQMTKDKTLCFNGNLSLENNGGFSSLRIRGKKWNLKDWKGICIDVKGDGRRYGLRITTDQRYRRSNVSFTADFQTQKDTWTTLHIPFSAMKASWRGRQLDREFNPAEISGLGMILADKVAGKFNLEIRSISTWR